MKVVSSKPLADDWKVGNSSICVCVWQMVVKSLAFAQKHARDLVKPKELDEMIHKTELPGHVSCQ